MRLFFYIREKNIGIPTFVIHSSNINKLYGLYFCIFNLVLQVNTKKNRMKGFAVIYLELFAFKLNRNNFHLSAFFREYDFWNQEAEINEIKRCLVVAYHECL